MNQSIQLPVPSNRQFTRKQFRYLVLILVLVILALYWIFSQVPFEGIASVLSRIELLQILGLMFINIALLIVYNLRWWVILKQFGSSISYPRLMVYRLAGYALSYFSPGPQIGGEFYQAYMLQTRHDVTREIAFSSVLLDRVVDVMVNFTFLFMGLITLLISGIIITFGGPISWFTLGFILILPGLHSLSLYRGVYPMGFLVGRTIGRSKIRFLVQISETIIHTEKKLGWVMQKKTSLIVFGVLISLCMWLIMILEYVFILTILGINPSVMDVVMGLTAARFAYMVTPLPGGLGGYEASQVFAMQMIGSEAAIGVAISLIVRARDLVWGVAGIGLGGWSWLKKEFPIKIPANE